MLIIYLHTVQLLPFNFHSIQHYSFICTLSNGSKYCYVILIIQFKDTVKEFQVFLSNINNSIEHYLNDFKYCYVMLTIQININHLFVHS